jgi:hypothetical protein
MLHGRARALRSHVLAQSDVVVSLAVGGHDEREHHGPRGLGCTDLASGTGSVAGAIAATLSISNSGGVFGREVARPQPALPPWECPYTTV